MKNKHIQLSDIIHDNKSLYDFIKNKYKKLESVFCVYMVPEQGEDIYTILVNKQDIIVIEFSRIENSISEIETIPLDRYISSLCKKGKRDFLKFLDEIN